MRKLEVIIMLPLVIISLLLLAVIDLVRTTLGKQTVDEEWHKDYVEGNMNHGQGKMRE